MAYGFNQYQDLRLIRSRPDLIQKIKRKFNSHPGELGGVELVFDQWGDLVEKPEEQFGRGLLPIFKRWPGDEISANEVREHLGYWIQKQRDWLVEHKHFLKEEA